MNALATAPATFAAEQPEFRPLQVEHVIGKMPNLPAGLQILPKLLKVLDDPAADCNALAEIIRIDSGLTASVFRVSNSVQFAGRVGTHSLSEAVTRLGMREVYRLLISIVTAPTLRGPDGAAFGHVDLWHHSLATAIASQVLAERLTKEDPEIAFSSGLLHDIGKTLLIRANRKQYVSLLKSCADNNRSVRFAEWERYGMDHADVGGELLRHWQFPERQAATVAGHHRPETVAKEHQRLAALVCVGNIIAYKLGVGNGHPPYVSQPDRDILGMIGLKHETLSAYDEEILTRLKREQDRL
jgi:putative nucleotidyltransferase with HDIG domain